jgi:hypothetical protein
MQMLGGELERLTASRRSYWWLPGDVEAARPAGVAHLLQAYDEYIVAYTESRGVMDVAGNIDAVAARTPFYHVIILGGQAIGRWRRQVRGSRMIIEVQFLRRPSGAERRAVADAVERYSAFCGLPAETLED